MIKEISLTFYKEELKLNVLKDIREKIEHE